MSTPPLQPRRLPLAEPSESQANSSSPKPGIRLVPYTPPRLDRSESRQSSSAGSLSGSSSVGESRHRSHSPSPNLGAPSSPTRPSRARHAPDDEDGSAPSSSSSATATADYGAVSEHAPGALTTPGSTSTSSAASFRQRLLQQQQQTPTVPVPLRASSAASASSSGSNTITPSPRPLQGLDEIDELDEAEISPPPSPIAPLPRKLPELPQLPRRQKFVAVHSDNKTFSLVPLTNVSSRTDSVAGSASGSRTYRAPPSVSISVSASTTTGSTNRWRRQSDIFSEADNPPSSPATTLPEADTSLCSLSSAPNWETFPDEDSCPPSPSSPRIAGSLRKIPKTPDLKHTRQQTPTPDIDSSPSTPVPYHQSPKTARNQGLHLVTKVSLQSIQTDVSEAETPNYRVYSGSSPDSPSHFSIGPSLSESNYQVIAASPVRSIDESEENYVVHGLSPSSSVVSSRLRPQFSQESLTVAPLKPGRKGSIEKLGFYKSRSRESLRRTGSLASISSYLTQEAIQSFLTIPPPVHLNRSTSSGSSFANIVRSFDPAVSQFTFPATAISSSSSPSKAALDVPPVPQESLPSQPPLSMVPHPHQWSSQLSTVASESDIGSDISSRPNSVVSAHNRHSSGHMSSHGRRHGSLSSITHSRSISETLEAVSPAFYRGGNPLGSPLVNYHDEDGDGLADLHALHHRPSRRRLSSFFSNTSSDRNLHSSASSRANSFNSASLPAWARLYYGSGEKRKLLMPSSDSLYSAFIRDAQPSASPDPSPLPPTVNTHRRRATETNPGPIVIAADPPVVVADPPMSEVASSEVAPVFRLRAAIRKQTSSIWSPHLGYDRRASRYSIWQPPPTHWNPEPTHLGRRNIQRVFFLTGFALPFTWIIASFLPLPPNPAQEVVESDDSDPNFRRDLERHRIQALDDIQYRSARWWRQINRCMSVFGLLIIATAVTLTVVGIRQRWGKS